MGREVTGINVMDKKPNGVTSNGSFSDRVRVSPKIAAMVEAMDHEIKESAEGNSLSAKSTKLNASLPEERNDKSEVQKMSDEEKELSSPIAITIPVDKEHTSPPAPQQSDQATVKHVTHTQTVDAKADSNGQSLSPNAKNAHSPDSNGQNLSPNAKNTHSPNSSKNSQTNSPFTTRKLAQHDKKHHEDEDNWSVTSSSVASGRTARFKVTVGTAPTFRSSDRAEKRKEFYMKLEEKNRALEEERLQYEARRKEEEDAAIKQLRKNLVIKAKPVPSFYYEAPPPKTEIKKPPLTRPRSPKLSRPKSPRLSRRKSCGDVVNNSSSEASTRVHHSTCSTPKSGSGTPGTHKNKDLITGRKSHGACKTKEWTKPDKETQTAPPNIIEQTNVDISVQ
ncbi:unnamed protein product [Lathyrus sativus]|nr:unnamed protein product [Lathyrus sativus]